MSKMGNAFFEMQEDAMNMTQEQFVAKHGKNNLDIYQEITLQSSLPDPEQSGDQANFDPNDEIPF